jgi:surface protein
MRISGPVTYMGKSSYGDTNLTKVISLGETLQVTRSLLAQESGVQSVPNLPGSLNNIQRFFESANLTGTVGYANWDISSVRDMNFIFANASSIDSGVAQWDVSNLQIFDAMFQSTTFNEDITGWDTSSATRMSQMFFANTSFMQDITGWNVSGVTYCQRFRYAAPQVPVPSFSSCNPN